MRQYKIPSFSNTHGVEYYTWAVVLEEPGQQQTVDSFFKLPKKNSTVTAKSEESNKRKLDTIHNEGDPEGKCKPSSSKHPGN